jgi:serine/threonine protein phosphatase PrpC
MAPPHLSTATDQAGRPHQEDRYFRVRDPATGGDFFGVFDGHGGSETVKRLTTLVAPAFYEALRTARHFPATWTALFRTLSTATAEDSSGSTASFVYIPALADWAYVAVLGDSPVMAWDRRGKWRFAPSHNVAVNASERGAAQARGGTIAGGYLIDPDIPGVGLQMSRALGDRELDRVLDRTPDCAAWTLGPKSIVLVGTDGLFTFGIGTQEDQMARLAERLGQGWDAPAIVQDAVERGAMDNVTAVVWRASGA